MKESNRIKSKFDYLYILFVHDDGSPEYLSSYVSLIENTEYSANIKVIVIFNKREVLGTLPKAVYTNLKYPGGYVVDYATHIYENFKDSNNKSILIKIQILKNWKDAFDFVLSNYQYEKIILQTVSHSNGVAINANGYSFSVSKKALTYLPFFKHKVSRKTNCWKKKVINIKKQGLINLNEKFVSENINTSIPFFICQKKLPTQISKNNSFSIRFVKPRDFNQLREFDRLFVFELSNYLNQRKIFAEAILFNSCYVASLDNFFNLKNIARFIVASPAIVPHKFFDPQKIIQIIKDGFSIEQIISFIESRAKEIIDHDDDYKLKLKISLIETKHIDKLIFKFDEVISTAIEEIKKGNTQGGNGNELRDKIYADFHHVTGTKEPPKHKSATKDPDIYFYDIITLLDTLKAFIPNAFSLKTDTELNDILKNTVKYYFEHGQKKEVFGISVYIPGRDNFFSKRVYYYNYYYSLDNKFINHSCYTNFIKLISMP